MPLYAVNSAWFVAFREVVDSGSFTKAAEGLFVSQPAISQQVRQLEQHFNTKLVKRAGRLIELTDAGRLVYELACRVTADIDATRAQVRALAGEQQLVTIASSPTALMHSLPAVLGRFWSERPDVAVKTIVRFGRDITAAVRTGTADLGLHGAQYLDDALIATPTRVSHLVCIASSSSELAQIPDIDVDQVAAERIITTPVGTETRDLVVEWFRTRGAVLHDFLEVSSHEEIRSAVLADLGIGFVGDALVREDVRAGRLVQLLCEEFDIAVAGYVSYRKDLSAPAAGLMHMLVREFQATPLADQRSNL